MKINKIGLKNFMRYANSEQILDTSGSGISVVCGNNGSGKSSCLIDSLLFAFYAKYRTPKIDDIVNRYIGKNTKVSVEFEEDGETYKVIRYRAHDTHANNVYIFKGDKDISGHTASETNQIILEKIKMPYIAFTNSTVFSTELYNGFLENSPSDRLVVFENILSLKEITLFYLKCKEFIKKINSEIDEIKLSLSGKDSEIITLENTLSNYSANAKTSLLKLKSEKENNKNKKEEALKKLENYSSINIDEEKRKILNNKLIEEYSKQIENKKKELNSLELVKPTKEYEIFFKYKDVNFEDNFLKEERHKEELELLKIRENGYNLSLQRISTLSSKETALNNELGSNNSSLVSISKDIDSLNKSICPFCGQKMHNVEDKITELKNKEKELISSNEEINKELENILKDLKEERENYNYLLADYNKIKESQTKNFIPNSKLVEEQFNNSVKAIKEYEEKLKNNSVKKELIENEITEIELKIKDLEVSKFTSEEIENISELINEQTKIISECDSNILAIDKSVKSVFDLNYVNDLKKQIEDKKKELEEINSTLEIKKEDLFYYEYLQECFSNKSSGFKKHFIGELIDVFNEKINQYLPFFFEENVKINFDKDLNETITMDDFDVSFLSFSQGQRQRAELSISFALFDVARIFFSNDNKLLILDEVDKGLDKFGIKAMINLLNGFDKQLRIFVVSHNPLLTDEIDDKIKIEKDSNGFSIINQ